MENQHNPDAELAAQLRDGVGREWVEEAAEDEEQTEVLRQRRMDLQSVAEEAAHRGERATAEMEGTSVSGPIIATGSDYVTIKMPEQEADVRLDSATWSFVAGEAGSPGTSTQSGMSFLGLLKEHSSAGRRVRLEIVGGNPLMGKVDTVSQDHLRVEDPDGRFVYVSIANVRAVIRGTSH